MAWRGLHISEPARLSLDRRAVTVQQDRGTVRFPLEDVAWIVIETEQATVTSALLAACAIAGIAVMLCDGKHMPCGVSLPLGPHHRHAAVLRSQIDLPKSLRAALWRRIVRRKIRNQAAVLAESAGAQATAPLRAMADLVRLDDADNVEARAARAYWPLLFGAFPGFRRHGEDRGNALLNYGYALVRAGMARGLVAHGFAPALGLHHANATNAFNLADDLIEPYRPLVDRIVMVRLRETATDKCLTGGDRRALLAIFQARVKMAADRLTLLDAVERSVVSLGRAILASNATMLELPEVALQ